jgi:hypothetical protein
MVELYLHTLLTTMIERIIFLTFVEEDAARKEALASAEIMFWITINTAIVTVIAAITENVMCSSE